MSIQETIGRTQTIKNEIQDLCDHFSTKQKECLANDEIRGAKAWKAGFDAASSYMRLFEVMELCLNERIRKERLSPSDHGEFSDLVERTLAQAQGTLKELSEWHVEFRLSDLVD